MIYRKKGRSPWQQNSHGPMQTYLWAGQHSLSHHPPHHRIGGDSVLWKPCGGKRESERVREREEDGGREKSHLAVSQRV